MNRPHRTALALAAALALCAAAAALSACGYSSDSKSVVEGEPVQLGEPKYNVVFSRFLNPNDNEDSAYLTGQKQLPPGDTYFGVFFEVQNESEDPRALADSFTIQDSDGNSYDAIPSESLYALPFGGEVESQEQIPVLDSTAQQGPIEGSIVLFQLPAAASEARPLVLEVPGPDGPAEITLDL
jgi:hypothetical protein